MIDHYEAEIVSATDYYPFGMPSRVSLTGKGYSHGFNGKLNDNDVKGWGNQQDYGMRIYDPRVGRFLSVDPITKEYADLTPYQFASNTPIWAIDLDGLEGVVASPLGTQNVLDRHTAQKAGAAVAKWVLSKHNQGMRNVEIAEQAKQQAIKQGRLDGDGITRLTKAGVYLSPWWNSTATYSDANDGAVLLQGKNLDGTVATTGDYVAASAGVLIPFIAGGVIKKFFSATNSGAGKDVLEGILKKVDNITSALDEKHVRAAINDIFGKPVVINGKTYDHLTEVRNALKGLGNQIENLNKAIYSGKLTDDVLDSAIKARNELQKTKDSIKDALNRAEKKVKQQSK